jgi:hypothetical protein
MQAPPSANVYVKYDTLPPDVTRKLQARAPPQRRVRALCCAAALCACGMLRTAAR